LIEKNLLVSHEESDTALSNDAYAVLKPQLIPFISYPSEWSFGMLRHAALTTLRIQKIALAHGMTLKDASAYNIQFVDGQPLLIDTLSFEKRVDGEPWIAYRQFCQHFLAPLALMGYHDVRLNGLFRDHIDGVPLDMASKLLPLRTRLRPGIAIHIHAHAAAQKKMGDSGAQKKSTMTDNALTGLLNSLRGAVRGLRWNPGGTVWGDYYNDTNYTGSSAERKAELVKSFLTEANPSTVWDLGANDGRFSRIASDGGAATVAFDIDPAAVEQGYRAIRRDKLKGLLPLVVDLSNPSSAMGWAHRERMSFLERGPADCVMALALIHHLAIGNNVPWRSLVDFFAMASKYLIIEFVPKHDSQVQRMLRSREDVFPFYDRENFEQNFERRFECLQAVDIEGSERTLYLLKRRED
jgi:hypothetical protein